MEKKSQSTDSMPENAKYNLIVHICQASPKALTELWVSICTAWCESNLYIWAIKIKDPGGFNLRMKILYLNTVGIRLFQKV